MEKWKYIFISDNILPIQNKYWTKEWKQFYRKINNKIQNYYKILINFFSNFYCIVIFLEQMAEKLRPPLRKKSSAFESAISFFLIMSVRVRCWRMSRKDTEGRTLGAESYIFPTPPWLPLWSAYNPKHPLLWTINSKNGLSNSS